MEKLENLSDILSDVIVNKKVTSFLKRGLEV
ncbi:hypothetical protein SDC9_174103 [bioreactor metagenome]|uniref:Uncharacterized protein n=1 Tax=bioreactor metagenome TaxID=1076179 RepID=A0A645GID3_9ZZZZ